VGSVASGKLLDAVKVHVRNEGNVPEATKEPREGNSLIGVWSKLPRPETVMSLDVVASYCSLL
jgi:hypothetical protein